MRHRLAILLLLLSSPLARAGEKIHTVDSRHYKLFWEGSAEKAEEMSRVLEAAWEEFRKFFGTAPKLKKGERLLVRFFQKRAGWEAGIRKDGTNPPRSGGGYYWPPTKTAYLYRQPMRYYTRCLFIHEVAHQFHYLSRTGNRDPRVGWYTEGVVEHLAWHFKDYPTKSL
ncbi:MAG: hypothetical protein ACYTHM_08240 [Planctomycetota bacterium]|jgi:hypothetical protein